MSEPSSKKEAKPKLKHLSKLRTTSEHNAFINSAAENPDAKKASTEGAKLLHVTGNMSRKESCLSHIIQLSLLKENRELMDEYTSGSDNAIFNYLIKRALLDIIKKNEVIVIDAKRI